MQKKQDSFESICIKDEQIENNAAHVLPIYATSTFVYDDIESALDYFQGRSDKHAYSRLSNPTTELVAHKIARLEGYHLKNTIESFGVLFGSGMAAISTAILSSAVASDTILTTNNIYGTSNEFLQKILLPYSIQTKYVDFNDVNAIEQLLIIDKSIKVFYIETPSNPTLACYDLESISNLAKKYNITTIVDNTFATPFLQRPLHLGIDIVVHSGTKFLNGHGTGISGAAVTSSKEIYKKINHYKKMLGGICSPFEAYLLNNGIKTLPIRMQKHQENALQLANFLTQHHKVRKVNYLGLESHGSHIIAKKQMFGFGGMLSFELDGDYNDAISFMKKIQFCSVTASLGTADTLITHNASTSHANMKKEQRIEAGIPDGLIRVSVGLEHIDEIIYDIESALKY
jgi:methionine-gamma-lyase